MSASKNKRTDSAGMKSLEPGDVLEEPQSSQQACTEDKNKVKTVVGDKTGDATKTSKARSKIVRPPILPPTGNKRKTDVPEAKPIIKRRKSGENEAKALQDFGHLVNQHTKKYIPHASGTVAIPSAPEEDSEFEDVMFSGETRVTLWQTYKDLCLEILHEVQLKPGEKERLKILAFDTCGESDMPMLCPVDQCTRTKPVYSRVGFLRHVVESHLPKRPQWRCPFQSGKCGGSQPRKIAHVRHVGWVHSRPYALAAALTFRSQLRYLEDNPGYVCDFRVTGPRADHFYKQLGETPPQVVDNREYRTVVFSSSSSSSSSSPSSSSSSSSAHSPSSGDELDKSCAYEIVEGVTSENVPLNMPSIEVPPVGAQSPVESPPVNKPEKVVEAVSLPDVAQGLGLAIKHGNAQREKALQITEPPTSPQAQASKETVEATETLVQVLADMEEAGSSGDSVCANPPSPPLKRIPDLFLFEDNHQYINPSVGEVERMIKGLRELQITQEKQNSIHMSLVASLHEIKTTVDEQEGNVKMTGEQLQATIDLQRKLYHSQQAQTSLREKCSCLELEREQHKKQAAHRDNSIKLLENHVVTLQGDVKRLTVDNAAAENTIIQLQRKVKSLEGATSFASKVAVMLRESGLDPEGSFTE